MIRGVLEEFRISDGILCKFNDFIGMNEVPVLNRFNHSMKLISSYERIRFEPPGISLCDEL